VGTDYSLEKLPDVSGPGLVEAGRYIMESLRLEEKEKIPPEWEIPEEEESPLSGAWFVPWYS